MSAVTAVYRTVVDDVIQKVKDDFIQEGFENVLVDLQTLWETKLMATGALNIRQEPQPGAAPARSAYQMDPFAGQSGQGVAPGGLLQGGQFVGDGYLPAPNAGGGPQYDSVLGRPQRYMPQTWAGQTPGQAPQQQALPAPTPAPAPAPAPAPLAQDPGANLDFDAISNLLSDTPAAAAPPPPAAAALPASSGGGDASGLGKRSREEDGDGVGLAHKPFGGAEFDLGLGAGPGPTPADGKGVLEGGVVPGGHPGAGQLALVAPAGTGGGGVKGEGSGGEVVAVAPAAAPPARDDGLSLSMADVAGDEDEDEPDAKDFVLAQFEKVTRSKNKWKCTLLDGIMHVGGRDYLFQRAQGEFQW